MAIRLTVYGRREWLGLSALAALCCAGLAFAAWAWSPLALLGLAVVLPVWGWVLWFFRDPCRRVPSEPGLFISPADGRVTDITQLGSDSPLGRPGVAVGIFMSVFDVHVNRSPCDARVEKVVHNDGLYLDVRLPRAWAANEAATIHLAYSHNQAALPVVVRQVAGLVARRIVTDLKPGQQVTRGGYIGMIKFGSRLELMVPAELAPQVCVQIGQRVLAGETILVRVEENG